MSVPMLVFGAVLLLPFVWFIGTYNTLVRLRQHVRESWSGIDTELKRRYELIPNLVETVKGYAAHEREVLEAVARTRQQAVEDTGSPESRARHESELVAALSRMFVVVEDYPELKASRNFLQLQEELVNTEDRIQAARRFYNANVRDLNSRVEMIPSSFVAAMFSFVKREYFQVESATVRTVPRIDLA